jgi:hypothetical protein
MKAEREREAFTFRSKEALDKKRERKLPFSVFCTRGLQEPPPPPPFTENTILYMYSICALKSPLPKILCRQTNQTQQTSTRQSQHQPIYYIALFYLFARNCTTAEDDLLSKSSERNLRKSKLWPNSLRILLNPFSQMYLLGKHRIAKCWSLHPIYKLLETLKYYETILQSPNTFQPKSERTFHINNFSWTFPLILSPWDIPIFQKLTTNQL